MVPDHGVPYVVITMNLKEKMLKERGHSDPKEGAKVITELQLSGDAQHILEKIKAGDSYVKRHLLTEINYSFEQWVKEGRTDVPNIGRFKVEPYDMDWARSMVATLNIVELRGQVTQEYMKQGDWTSRKMPFTCLFYPEFGYVADIDAQGQWY